MISDMLLFNMIGFVLIHALFKFFLKDVIRISEDMTFVVMGIPLIIAVCSALLWIYISNKLYKCRAYIIAALASALLGLFGYAKNSSSGQPLSTVLAIRFLMSFAPGICFLISIYFVTILPVTRERFEEIKKILEERTI